MCQIETFTKKCVNLLTFNWKSGIILVGYSKRGRGRLLYPDLGLLYPKKPIFYFKPTTLL